MNNNMEKPRKANKTKEVIKKFKKNIKANRKFKKIKRSINKKILRKIKVISL